MSRFERWIRWFTGAARSGERVGGPLDCKAVGRVLQQVLDGETDDRTADEVAAHLEACLVCGLEADTYLRIKESLLAHGVLDHAAADRLRDFGRALADGRLDDLLRLHPDDQG